MMKSFLKFAVIIGITLLLSGCTSTKDVEEISCKYVSVIIQDEWNELARTNGSFRKYMSSGNYRPATCAAVASRTEYCYICRHRGFPVSFLTVKGV